MPEGDIVTCLCDETNQPLWGFCDDDLYCPRCGRPVAGLACAHQLAPGDPHAPVWVYPQKKHHTAIRQYAFPLTLHYADLYRRRRERAPVVDLNLSSGSATAWFAKRLDRSPHDKGNAYTCRLIRNDEALPPDDAPEELDLPVEGVENLVDLVGDFGRRSLLLKICNTPQIDVELEGRGIEEVDWASATRDPGVVGRWEVMLSEALEAELTIRALTAPVVLAEALTSISAVQLDDPAGAELGCDVAVQLLEPIPAGAIIAPKRPWRSKVRLDARRFAVPGRRCQLLINLKTAIVRTPPLILDLERVEKGRIAFWPDPLTVDVMYAGEFRSNAPHKNVEGPEHPPAIRKLFISNIGDEKIRLRPPRVLREEEGMPANWLAAAWATDVEERSRLAGDDGVLELDPGQQAEIEVIVDLRGLESQGLEAAKPDRGAPGEGCMLRATIATRDERDAEWRVEFRIGEVQPRTPAPFPLAIDFGNSHSYTAIWNPGDPFPLRELIVPAHELREPEAFPTAIFFRDLSDPRRPVYEIGHEAVRLGQGAPHALATDLKRWIGAAEGANFRLVGDALGSPPVKFRIDELIQLYLCRLIQRAEVLLRKHRITAFGASYPSRFNPERRAAFGKMIGEFCRRSARDFGLHPLEAVEFDIDEANAVAIGFVFDETAQRDELPRLVTPDRPSFVVASFDWGGGSLDTALLRFTVEDGDLAWPVFQSEYLGIGGDERFGGDNVTIAVLEMLMRRLSEALGPAGAQLLARIPRPDEEPRASPQQAHIYRSLWTAAEAIKIHQSRQRHARQATAQEGNASPPPTDADQVASAADAQRIADILQMQLLHGLPLEDSEARGRLEQAIQQGDFLLDLEEVARHVIQRDMFREGGYAIRDRLAEGADELCRFAERQHANIDFVVLGGSACRLPLVAEMFREKLPQARLIYDFHRTKFRVAYGLARYLHVQQAGDVETHALARSRDYTSAEIGLVQPGSSRFIPIIPNCAPVNAPEIWRPLQSGGKPLRLAKLLGKNRVLPIYRQDRGQQHRLLGFFDLTCRGDAPSDSLAAFPEQAVAEVRLLGSELDQELRVRTGDQQHGLWRLRPGAPPK